MAGINENNVFIITGPCGVGKSTTARLLAEKYTLSCHINVDLLYGMLVGGYIDPWKDDGSRMGLLWKNLQCLIKNYLEANYTVFVDYIVFPEDIKHIENNLSQRIKYVVLMTNEDILRKRDAMRPLDEVMGNRAVELLNEFKDKNIDEKFLLDTSFLTIDKVIEIIMKEDRFLI